MRPIYGWALLASVVAFVVSAAEANYTPTTPIRSTIAKAEVSELAKLDGVKNAIYEYKLANAMASVGEVCAVPKTESEIATEVCRMKAYLAEHGHAISSLDIMLGATKAAARRNGTGHLSELLGDYFHEIVGD